MLHTIAFIAALLLILATLLDGFETILLPRRVSHRFRYARFYFRTVWPIWRRASVCFKPGRYREGMLSVFGPLSLLGLFASWITILICGFGLLQWSLAHLSSNSTTPGGNSFSKCLYFSGTTYFTLGLGDVVPTSGFARFFTVIEGGLGFGFLAIIISYLPVLYQAFSQRELTISLLDARAGSPPTGAEFLRRRVLDGRLAVDESTLREWEVWSAELLESHISFPILAYYRSQHANQSWLSALATMLDSCAMLMAISPPAESLQAQLTLAIARHAAVDISLIFSVRPIDASADRITAERAGLQDVLQVIRGATIDLIQIETRYAEIRRMYEPFLVAMADYFVLSLPLPHSTAAADNWQRSAWMPSTPGIGQLPLRTEPTSSDADDHFN